MIKKSRFDNLRLGIILGLVFPTFGFLIFYLWSFSKVSFAYFVEYALQISAVSKLLSLSLLSNLLVFFLFILKNYYLTARGILLSTFVWTFGIVLIYFLGE